jgi:hypothetical protein
MRRFFVRVFAADSEAFGRLPSYGLDLFRATAIAAGAALRARAELAAAAPAAGPADAADALEGLAEAPYVDGLLSLEDIERLVVDGYRVLVNADADRRARAQTETIDFDAWLKGMEER